MRSTMPDFPLTLQHFLWRSTTLFPTKEIVTRRETGRHRYTYADFGGRVAQLAHGLKGSSATMGASRLQRLCERLGHAPRDADGADDVAHLQLIADEALNAVAEALA